MSDWERSWIQVARRRSPQALVSPLTHSATTATHKVLSWHQFLSQASRRPLAVSMCLWRGGTLRGAAWRCEAWQGMLADSVCLPPVYPPVPLK